MPKVIKANKRKWAKGFGALLLFRLLCYEQEKCMQNALKWSDDCARGGGERRRRRQRSEHAMCPCVRLCMRWWVVVLFHSNDKSQRNHWELCVCTHSTICIEQKPHSVQSAHMFWSSRQRERSQHHLICTIYLFVVFFCVAVSLVCVHEVVHVSFSGHRTRKTSFDKHSDNIPAASERPKFPVNGFCVFFALGCCCRLPYLSRPWTEKKN